MEWLIILAEEPLNPAQVGLIVITIISLLPAAYYIIGIYQKLYPKRAHEEAYVTVSELHAAINTVRQESANGIGSVRRKQEEMQTEHRRFVTREELLNSRNTLLEPLMAQVKEHGTLIHELSEYIHQQGMQHQGQLNQIGLKLEGVAAKMYREIAVIKERLRIQKDKDDGNGSDDNIKT